MENLDKSWESKACNEQSMETLFPYIQGASDFQNKAIEKLESFINYSESLNHAQPNHQDTLIMCIEIIKKLKAD